MGGVTAQEVIKIVTEQLVPVNNTFVFNGMKSATAVYEL
jgi:amyloid beta precursor protein binding protein 1